MNRLRHRARLFSRIRPLAALAAGLSTASLGVVPAGAQAPTGSLLPSRSAPNGFTSIDVAGGGRIVVGSLPGATTQQAALRAGSLRLQGYFDSPPTFLNAVRTKDGRVTIALFRATLNGTAVTGLAITALAPSGGSRGAIVYDTANRFPKTMAALITRLRSLPVETHSAAGGPAAVAPATRSQPRPIPALIKVPFNDGTGSISLPADWTPKSLGMGTAIADGPDSMRIGIGVGIPVNDPNGRLVRQQVQMGMRPPGIVAPYTKDVVQAFLAVEHVAADQRGGPDDMHVLHSSLLPSGNQATIEGTHVVDGTVMRFSTLVTVIPPSSIGTWLLSLSTFAAPESDYDADRPLLVAIVRSYRFNGEQMSRVTSAWIAQSAADSQALMNRRQQEGLDAIRRSGEISQANAQAAQDNMDRYTAGVINSIKGNNVVEYLPTGEHGTADNDLAQTLAQQDPEHFAVVPVSEYRKGEDY